MLRRLCLLWLGTIATASLALAASAAPRNVILMIGDGMGPNQVISAQLTKVGDKGKLVMQTLPVHSNAITRSVLGDITDSAAAATALATGVKTTNGTLGLDKDGKRLRNLVEAAHAAGHATGVVTTTQITNATPAGFTSHVKNRSQEPEIAEQQLTCGVDVLTGGGLEFWVPKDHSDSKRTDDQDLIAKARQEGYQVALSSADFKALKNKRYIALLNVGGLTTNAPEPSLAEIVKKAVKTLNAQHRGFFLMVEGGQIDWRCHANDLAGSIDQVLKFDSAVKAAQDFAKKDGHTLVIVTADHETGGLELIRGEGAKFEGKFSFTHHSATPVDVWAFGDSSREFAKVRDNTDIPKTIARLTGWKTGEVEPAAAAAK